MRKTFLPLGLLTLGAMLLAPAAASAAYGTAQLSSSSYTVGEGDGNAVIAVTRTDARTTGEIRYGVNHLTAQQYQDYKPVGGRIDFAVGQTTATFDVPIVDDSNVEPSETIHIHLYGAHPMALGSPAEGTLTINDNDAISTVRDAANPLALNPAPPATNPLLGARFYVDTNDNLAGKVANRIRGKKAGSARMLSVIANQPESKRFGTWTKDAQHDVAKYLAKAAGRQPGAVPLLATYRLQHLQCGGVTDTPAQVAAYKRWYQQFAQGIGNHDAVVFLEIDALITSKCLSHHGLDVRVDEVSSAIDTLSRVPHAVVYVDAGAADAHQVSYIARLLRRVGVAKIQGFFANSTHYDWTGNEISYGRTLSRLTGGKHFVVNTAVNGRGPLRPKSRVKDGNEVRCNPAGRGLGPKPTSNVTGRSGGHGLDGLFWIGNPGRSTGECGHGDPPTGEFFLDYALMLIKNADFRIRSGPQ
jgi:endoglucanase